MKSCPNCGSTSYGWENASRNIVVYPSGKKMAYAIGGLRKCDTCEQEFNIYDS